MIRQHERGLLFVDHEFKDVLRPGTIWIADPYGRVRVDVVSVRDLWLEHSMLDAIVQSGALGPEIEIVRPQPHERAVVWVNRRVEAVLEPGLYALWTVFHEVHVDVVEAHALGDENRALSGPFARAATGRASSGRRRSDGSSSLPRSTGP